MTDGRIEVSPLAVRNIHMADTKSDDKKFNDTLKRMLKTPPKPYENPTKAAINTPRWKKKKHAE